MLRFTFRQLEYFVAVGELGSIALAAEKVNVSSPSISSAISQLETELGLPLFVRQRAQGLSLTSAGRQLHEQARNVLSEAGRLRDMAGDISGQVRGPLSVGCLVSFAQVVLPSLRRQYLDAYPEVRFSQTERDQTEIFSALRRAEIDLALTYDLNLPADMNFEPLMRLPPFVMVGQDHAFAGWPSVGIAELAGLPMVLLDLPHSSDYFLSFFNDRTARPRIAERTRDIAVMRGLVANGFGYAFANMRPLDNAGPDGKPLHFIALTGDIPALTMGLLMSGNARNASVVRSFVDFAKERIGQDADHAPRLSQARSTDRA